MKFVATQALGTAAPSIVSKALEDKRSVAYEEEIKQVNVALLGGATDTVRISRRIRTHANRSYRLSGLCPHTSSQCSSILTYNAERRQRLTRSSVAIAYPT